LWGRRFRLPIPEVRSHHLCGTLNWHIISDLLAFLEGLPPAPSAYSAAVRRLRSEAGLSLRPLKIAIAASFRADPLVNYLIVEGALRGFRFDVYSTPYGQFEIACSTPQSPLFAADVIIIAAPRPEALVTAIRRSSAASIVVFNYTEPRHSPWGVRHPEIEATNRALDQFAEKTPGVVIFDFARLSLETGLASLYDPRLDYVSRTPFGPSAQLAIARGLARLIRATRVPPAKCLVLDLDNTLWGGILGEAGLGGIELGNDYPGSLYRDFQLAVRTFRDRGILLAIASKNNDTETIQILQQHPDMVLRLEDFAAVQIHWNDKASSLRAIASQLRIGLDSLVFYDDSPIERAWIRTELPEVTVIEVPVDPLQRVAALYACEAFDQTALSDEDRKRASLYQLDQKREEVRSESHTLSDFLTTLQIRVTTGRVDGDTLPRVAQLINKTNQFNLTGRRYTESEIQQQIDTGAIALWLRASDRFGDYGLVGAAIALPESAEVWRIDTFVLSCRILGRQVENELLSALTREVGAKRLRPEYIPTGRNAPAKHFYDTCLAVGTAPTVGASPSVVPHPTEPRPQGERCLTKPTPGTEPTVGPRPTPNK